MQLAKHGAPGDSMLQQDVDSLLTSQWSIQAVPDLSASRKHDLGLLRKWLSVSTHDLLCLLSLPREGLPWGTRAASWSKPGMHEFDNGRHNRCHEAIWLTQQVELGQLERQQTRKAGAALPKAEALLLATQQADRIYGKAFQEFTLQVQRPAHAQSIDSRLLTKDKLCFRLISNNVWVGKAKSTTQACPPFVGVVSSSTQCRL